MTRKVCSILVVVIIAVFVTLIIHPIISVNAAMDDMCRADKEMRDLALKNTSSTVSIVLMQINDSRLATDPKQAMIELQLANQSLGGLIRSLSILDQEHTLSGTIQQLNEARDSLNNDGGTQAADIIKDANRTIFEEAFKCPNLK